MDYIACAPNTKQLMSVVVDNRTDIFLLECFPAAQILTLISLKSYINKYFFTFELSTKELLEWKQYFWQGRSIQIMEMPNVTVHTYDPRTLKAQEDTAFETSSQFKAILS